MLLVNGVIGNRNACGGMVEKSEGKRSFGRPRGRMDVIHEEKLEGCELSGGKRWYDVVNTVINLLVP